MVGSTNYQEIRNSHESDTFNVVIRWVEVEVEVVVGVGVVLSSLGARRCDRGGKQIRKCAHDLLGLLERDASLPRLLREFIHNLESRNREVQMCGGSKVNLGQDFIAYPCLPNSAFQRIVLFTKP